MVKVTIDREGCISCGACWSTCPEVFEQNADDAKNQIVNQFQVGGNIAEGSIEKNLEECARQAADGCPVQVISVE